MTQLVKVKNTGHVPLVLEVCERDDAGAPSREIMILRPEEESYWIPLIEDRREVKIVENVAARSKRDIRDLARHGGGVRS